MMGLLVNLTTNRQLSERIGVRLQRIKRRAQ
jgi:hypothetical protein